MIETSRRALLGGVAALALPAIARSAETDLSFYFPVAVGGPITKIVDALVADFHRDNPGIRVSPIYAGTYQDTLTKAQTALKAGSGPQMAVLQATDVFSLIDDDLILPIDTLPGADMAWLDGFYPAFLRNGQINGHCWGVPFQRSTIVLYWNKDAFREAGLDPDKPPANWEEHASFAAKLTRRSGDAVDRWGVEIPSSGFPYWLFQALATEAGATLANAEGNVTDFDSPACVAALQYWIDLATKYQAHPPGVVEWGTTPRDFLERKVAMIWTTTGNLTNIRANAKFPFGVAMLPAGTRCGSPTGGGNFYLFRTASEPQQDAAMKLMRWVSSADRAAQWGIGTGYIATRPDAWDTPAMREYVAGFPQAAVARDQLQFAVPELSTHDNQRVTKELNDGLQAALTGKRPPEAALRDAQASASRLLRSFL
jgi:sn-glycerol 3-phosphate transport system substrate-binding protein